jgi:hypothetical protein
MEIYICKLNYDKLLHTIKMVLSIWQLPSSFKMVCTYYAKKNLAPRTMIIVLGDETV